MLDSDVRRFLSMHGIRLNKDLGQHFLVNESVLERIIGAANIQPKDTIVEIGAGIGILTRELVKRAQYVTAIEIDETFIPLLKEFVKVPSSLCHGELCRIHTCKGAGRLEPPRTHLTIINGNALYVPFPREPYKVVANIPYHITSPLLRHAFLESSSPPQSLTLLIQREVAEKICDAKNAGLLTIVVGLFGAPKIVATVPPSAFLPPPKVDSAILHIDCFEKPRTAPETIERIFTLVKLAFGQKRKMLRKSIGSLPNGMDILMTSDIDPKRRPQTLSIDEWIALANESR